jgi:von Willebrand factor type A domain
MKRALGILFLLTVALLPATLFADEAFILNIPFRGDAQQEIGEVRMTLGLSAPPGVAQLVVNGNVTVNLGQTQMIGTDSVRFEPGIGNVVKITYKPLSNFTGGNFCSGAGAQEKNINMRFSGPQDVVDYHISSYVVAAPATMECSKVSKRTADTPASVIPAADAVAPELAAIYRGRLPLDVILVLDKSGSMNDFPPGAVSGATKVQILKSALETFVTNWQEIDLATPDGGDWSDDRMGVVFFDSAAAAQSLPGGMPPANFFIARGSTNPGPWQAIVNDIGTLTPGGSTSVGGGINEGMKQWVLDPAHDVHMVLVTDGMQNTAPLIAPTASGFLGLAPVNGLPQELRSRFIQIQSIGFGIPAVVDEALLTNISVETAGRSYITINANTMFNVFALTLVAILKGNTASLAVNQTGTMTGPGPGALLPVVVDRSARRVVYSLQWAPPMRNALELEVYRPGSAPSAAPTVPTHADSLPQAAIQSFLIGPADVGTWNVRVKRNRSEPNTAVPYTLNVFFLERDLDYRLTFDTIHAGTGDSIRVRARVSWDGKPLTGLPAGAIRVRVQRPPEGLGTILHDTRVEVSQGNTTTPAGDIQTALDRKLARLTDARLLARIMPKDLETITLAEEKNGLYSGVFSKTSTPGLYAFETVLDWDQKRTGHVRRQERLELHVKVKPDAASTTITMAHVDPRTVTISVTPRDKFGNFAGPGYASVVKAKLNSAGTLSRGEPVDRGQTGTYVFTVTGVPAGTTPNVDITVDGVRIGNTAKLKPRP